MKQKETKEMNKKPDETKASSLLDRLLAKAEGLDKLYGDDAELKHAIISGVKDRPAVDAALDALTKALLEISERADSNALHTDPYSDEHSGFIRIRDDARAALQLAREARGGEGR